MEDFSIFEGKNQLHINNFMVSFIIVHPEEGQAIQIRRVIKKCSLVENHPTLTVTPDRIKTSVSLAIFSEFISVLEEDIIKITDLNFTGRVELSEEFGFNELSMKFSQVGHPMKCEEAKDLKARIRIVTSE
jgi:hypothetical protein